MIFLFLNFLHFITLTTAHAAGCLSGKSEDAAQPEGIPAQHG